MTFKIVSLYFLVFFKQKTAYEMRISDWSSDVCSSDLPRPARRRHRLRWPPATRTPETACRDRAVVRDAQVPAACSAFADARCRVTDACDGPCPAYPLTPAHAHACARRWPGPRRTRCWVWLLCGYSLRDLRCSRQQPRVA